MRDRPAFSSPMNAALGTQMMLPTLRTRTIRNASTDESVEALGGGVGNRTLVREQSRAASTHVSHNLNFAQRCAHGQARNQAILPLSYLEARWRSSRPVSSNDASARSTDRLLTSTALGFLGRESECVIVGTYRFPLFIRCCEPADTQPILLCPRRNRSPPYRVQGETG